MNPEELTLEQLIARLAKKMTRGDLYDNIKRSITNPKTKKQHLDDIDDEEFRNMIEGLTRVYEEKKTGYYEH